MPKIQDEVRRMPNEKELVFIRGCNPIMDDKFHTLECPEFIASSELGPYVSKKKQEDQEKADEIHFFIDAEGDDADSKSYFYQIEQYKTSTTEDIYAHQLKEVDEHAANVLDNVLGTKVL